jgi:hypothetical protein
MPLDGRTSKQAINFAAPLHHLRLVGFLDDFLLTEDGFTTGSAAGTMGEWERERERERERVTGPVELPSSPVRGGFNSR